MKFTIDRETLLAPLLTVRGVIEQRHTLPVLSNILVAARDGVLAFTATDSEVELQARVSVDDSVDGEITVPARKIIDICQALPSQASVDFEVDDANRAHIRSGRSRFALTTLPASDYPTTEEIADESVFAIAQSELKRLIDLTQFAMARQDVRYYLNGLLLEVAPRGLKAVATDGHRLAVAHFESETGVEESKAIIVPRKGVLELARLLASEDAELNVRVGSNAVQLTVGDVRFTSKLIDGKFPDFQAGAERAATVLSAALSGANIVYESAGMYASLLGTCPQSLLLDNDVLGAIGRVTRGIEVNSDTFSFAEIQQICFRGEGHYLGSGNTLQVMQSEYIYPDFGDRNSPTVWEEQGKPVMLQKALEKTREVLARPAPRHVSDEIDTRIRSGFPIPLSPPAMGR